MVFEVKVIEIIERTPDVKSFRFSKPSGLEYKPGQFVFIKLRAEEGFMTKHFTISSSPTEQGFLEITKKLTGHPYSNALNSLKIGEKVTIVGPKGFFTFQGEGEKIAMLSGGVGITPLRSICRYCTDKAIKSDIVLLYGNRRQEDIVFRSEFDLMQEENKRLRVIHCLEKPPENWKGYVGFLTEEVIRKEICDFLDRVFYICGPPGMLRAMENTLNTLSVSKEKIKKEIFVGYQ
ncbi:FAD-dependent oxidoreductase [Candidatus Bathyarchaeota archaeon]|nr:FAD-dependent oxidoreductase [Candidatus Bathyarchaeota archaeon]